MIPSSLPKRSNLCLVTGVGLFLCILAAEAAAQNVQRLFTSPEQRAEMDRRRTLNLFGVQPEEELHPDLEALNQGPVIPDQAEVDVVYRFQGIVRRQDNSLTLWLNGENLSEADLPENMEIFLSENLLRIREPLTGQLFDIRPGQVLNLTQGKIRESFSPD